MKFSLRLNNDLTLPEYVALAQAAETAGFDQIWVSHDLFLRSAPVILAAMAQATTRIEIGTGILNPYTIHPAEMAMLAATMDELSGNRFNLGLAAGAGEFLKWVGIEQSKPLATTRETILAVRGLLRGERVEMNGEVLQLERRGLSALQAGPGDAHLSGRDGAKDVGPGRGGGRRCPAPALPAGTLFRGQALHRSGAGRRGIDASARWISPPAFGFPWTRTGTPPAGSWPTRSPTTATPWAR